MRMKPAIRDLVRETELSVSDLVCPMFVHENLREPKEIPSMPGVCSWPVEQVGRAARALAELGIPAVLLFGIPSKKDPQGSAGWDDGGVVPRAIAAIRWIVSRCYDLAAVVPGWGLDELHARWLEM